jgi:hypothetical protein
MVCSDSSPPILCQLVLAHSGPGHFRLKDEGDGTISRMSAPEGLAAFSSNFSKVGFRPVASLVR